MNIVVKNYLLKLKEIQDDIQSKEELKKEYLSRAVYTSIPMDEVRVQVSRSDNGRIERYGTLAADIEREIEQCKQNYFQFEQMIIKQIQGLHDAQYSMILFKVYVQQKSLKNVAQEINKSYSHTIALHVKALEKFGELHADKIANCKKRTDYAVN